VPRSSNRQTLPSSRYLKIRSDSQFSEGLPIMWHERLLFTSNPSALSLLPLSKPLQRRDFSPVLHMIDYMFASLRWYLLSFAIISLSLPLSISPFPGCLFHNDPQGIPRRWIQIPSREAFSIAHTHHAEAVAERSKSPDMDRFPESAPLRTDRAIWDSHKGFTCSWKVSFHFIKSSPW
jgi:hypothetical protein